jgi:hypothetical protein
VGLSLFVLFLPALALAATEGALEMVDLTGHWAGILSLVIFVAAYSLVIGEEVLHMRKSKPVIVAAGLIWVLVAIAFQQAGDLDRAHIEIRGDLLEFVELFLFLLAAMTFINTMEEHDGRAWRVRCVEGLAGYPGIFTEENILDYRWSCVRDVTHRG